MLFSNMLRMNIWSELFRQAHELVPPMTVQLMDRGFERIFLDAPRIAEHEDDGREHQDEPADGPVLDAAEEGDAGHFLSDADGEGIEHGSREADVRREIAHADAGDAVVTERDGQGNDDGRESDGFFTHAENCTEESEKKHDQHDDQVPDTDFAEKGMLFQTGGLPDESFYAGIDGFRAVDDPEGTADDQDKGDDPGLLLQTFEDGGEDLPGLRFGRDVPEFVSGIFTARDKPGRCGAEHDHREDDHISVRDFQFSFHAPKLTKKRMDLRLEVHPISSI